MGARRRDRTQPHGLGDPGDRRRALGAVVGARLAPSAARRRRHTSRRPRARRRPGRQHRPVGAEPVDGIGPAGESEREQRRRDDGDRHTDQDAGGGGRRDGEEPGAPAVAAGVRPIAASTCESSRRGARCLPTAWPTATSAGAATTAAAMSRPLRCSSAARWAPSHERAGGLDVAPSRPAATAPRSRSAASAGSCRWSHRMVPMSAASASDPPPKSGPATASASVDGSSTRSNGSRTMPTTSASPSWTRSKDSIDTRPSTGRPRPDLEPVLVGRPFVDHDLVGAPRSRVPPGDEQRPSETAR